MRCHVHDWCEKSVGHAGECTDGSPRVADLSKKERYVNAFPLTVAEAEALVAVAEGRSGDCAGGLAKLRTAIAAEADWFKLMSGDAS